MLQGLQICTSSQTYEILFHFFGFLYLTLGNPVAQLANLHKPICKIVCIILVSQVYQASTDDQGSILGLKWWIILFYSTHVDMGSILLIQTHHFRTRFERS